MGNYLCSPQQLDNLIKTTAKANKLQENKKVKRGWISFKTVNHILSIASMINTMIGGMVRNFISRETNVALKIYKILIRHDIE